MLAYKMHYYCVCRTGYENVIVLDDKLKSLLFKVQEMESSLL